MNESWLLKKKNLCYFLWSRYLKISRDIRNYSGAREGDRIIYHTISPLQFAIAFASCIIHVSRNIWRRKRVRERERFQQLFKVIVPNVVRLQNRVNDLRWWPRICLFSTLDNFGRISSLCFLLSSPLLFFFVVSTAVSYHSASGELAKSWEESIFLLSLLCYVKRFSSLSSKMTFAFFFLVSLFWSR